ALHDGLQRLGVHAVIALDANAERAELEDEILLGDAHLAGEVLDGNFCHTNLGLLSSVSAGSQSGALRRRAPDLRPCFRRRTRRAPRRPPRPRPRTARQRGTSLPTP